MTGSLCRAWKITSIIIVSVVLSGQVSVFSADLEQAPAAARKAQEAPPSGIENNGYDAGGIDNRRKAIVSETLDRIRQELTEKRKAAASKAEEPKTLLFKSKVLWLSRAYIDVVDNDYLEDTYALHSWLSFENKIKLNKYPISIFVSLDARYDTDFNNKDSDKDTDVVLQEAYLQLGNNPVRLRLGRQQLTWGKLDEIAILDVINPQDYTEGILLDKQQRKLPLLMAQGRYSFGNNAIEMVFIPHFKPDQIHFFGSDWALFDHLKEGIEKRIYPQGIMQTVANITVEDTDRAYTFDNSEGAIRFVGRALNWDYGLYYMYIYDRFPALAGESQGRRAIKRFLYNPTLNTLSDLMAATPTAGDLTLTVDYNRMNVAGADFEATFGNFGLRGELGIFLSPLYVREDFSLAERDTISFGLGLDYTTSNNFYWNLQLVERLIPQYKDLYKTDKFTHQLVGIFSKDFLRGKIIPSLYCGYNISYGDSFFNPELTYKVNDTVDVSVGSFVFNGNPSTTLGRFDANDVAYLTVEASF